MTTPETDSLIGTLSYSSLDQAGLIDDHLDPVPSNAVWMTDRIASDDTTRAGEAVHDALEVGLHQPPADTGEKWRTLAEDHVEKYHLDGHECNVIAEYLCLVGPALEQATVIATECSFSFVLDGWVVIGEIDVIIRTQSGAVKLLDFKTGAPEHVSALQLGLYLLASQRDPGLTDWFGGPPVPSGLFYFADLRTETVLTHEVTTVPEQRIRAILQRAPDTPNIRNVLR